MKIVHPILTSFERKNADRFEKISNGCLYFLRTALGQKKFTIQHNGTFTPFTDSTKKIDRIVSTIFAFLLLMPLTVGGIILLQFSKTHRQAVKDLKQFSPISPPKPILPPTPPSPPPKPSMTFIYDKPGANLGGNLKSPYKTIEFVTDNFNSTDLFFALKEILNQKIQLPNGAAVPVTERITFQRLKNGLPVTSRLPGNLLLALNNEEGAVLFKMIKDDLKTLKEITKTVGSLDNTFLKLPKLGSALNTIIMSKKFTALEKALL